MSQAGVEGVTLGVLADQVGMSKSGLFAAFAALLERAAPVKRKKK